MRGMEMGATARAWDLCMFGGNLACFASSVVAGATAIRLVEVAARACLAHQMYMQALANIAWAC